MFFSQEAAETSFCPATDSSPLPHNEKWMNCKAALPLVLKHMRSLLHHSHLSPECMNAHIDSRGNLPEPSAPCCLCHLLCLLCHWAAARMAMPEHLWAAWLTQRWMQRSGDAHSMEVAHLDGAKRHGCGEGGRAQTCRATSPASRFSRDGVASSVALLLPSYPSTRAKEDGTGEGQSDDTPSPTTRTNSPRHSPQPRDALWQQELNALFASVSEEMLPEEMRADPNKAEEAHLKMERLTALCEVYHACKHDDTLLFHPAMLPDEQIALLLEVYATASAELAALDLLRALVPSSQPFFYPARLQTVSRAFRTLLNAQQVASTGVRYFAPALSCVKLLHTCIRPLIAAVTRDRSPAGSAVNYLHSQVELSADSMQVVSGRGLVAAGAIAEGELLLQEACLVTVPGMNPPEVDAMNSDTLHKTLTAALDFGMRLTEQPKKVGVGVAAIDDDINGDGSASARGDGIPAPTVQCVLNILDGRVATSAEAWWLRWAVILPDELLLKSSVAPAAASLSHGSMRACIEAVVVAAYNKTDATREEAKSFSKVEPLATLPAMPRLPLVSLREVDELHMPRPPAPAASPSGPAVDSSKHLCGERLLPRQDSLDSAAAIFCRLGFVNHACAPNALVVYDTAEEKSAGGSVTASLIALRDIEQGEEITISYVPATTALTTSPAELAKVLGFACQCRLCTHKAPLLHGVLCGECGRLVWAAAPTPAESVYAQVLSSTAWNVDGEEPTDDDFMTTASAFCHAAQCSQLVRQVQGLNHQASGSARGGESVGTANSVVDQLRRQLDHITAHAEADSFDLDQMQKEIACPTEATEDGCDCCAHSAEPHRRARASQACPPDPLVAAVRQLANLDDCVAHALLPTHHLRLRTRLIAFAYAAAARGLGTTVHARLLSLCASTIEELDVLLGVHHPLLTGLRMHLVFSRGRHLRAVREAEAVAHGTRHADCCGAVREQAALMALPFVVDPLIRRCITRCFQEHFVQFVGWKLASSCAEATEEEVLWSFLRRYPIELDAAGVTTPEHMELLACMEDSNINDDEVV